MIRVLLILLCDKKKKTNLKIINADDFEKNTIIYKYDIHAFYNEIVCYYS